MSATTDGREASRRSKGPPDGSSSKWSFAADFTQIEWRSFDVATGLRAAFFSLTPLLLGIATNQLNAGVISSIGALNEGVVSTLGAININFQEGPSRSRLARSLLVGCVGNAVAFSFGTFVGTTGAVVAVPLVAMGVFLAMAVRVGSGLELVGLTAAVVFTVGVGLPGGSIAAAGTRFWLMLAGGAWALLGALLQSSLTRRSSPGGGTGAPAQKPPSRSDILAHSLAVAITVALGLGIAESAGLARDYWVMLTVVMSLRSTPSQTVSFTLMRVMGTAAGALIGLLLTLDTGSVLVLFCFLSVFSFAMFATRNMNMVIFTLFLTAFIIILLNLSFPGSGDLAFVRVIDVAIGGGLALAASAVMWFGSAATRRL
ncbi:MAG: FUSC family protein [Thaumarchaeota archaeon]|nr:FUSC family protein [Nitrososphaerota archaeon]